ncbi:MAG: glycosyltransferase 61 family protein [Phormidesmis sp.]
MIASALGQPLERTAVTHHDLNHCVARGEWEQVLRLCQNLLLSGLSSSESNSIDVYKNIYTLMGKAFVHQGDDDAAISAYLKGINLCLEQPQSHYALGFLYSRKQRDARAICHYQWALRLRPDWSKAAFNLGRLFYRVGCHDQALATYQSILERDPTYLKAHLALGRLHEQKGDFRLAIRQYRRAAFVSDCSKPTLSQPTLSQSTLSQSTLLQSDARLSKQRHRVTAYRCLGSALEQMEQPVAAAEIYSQAIALQPGDAALHTQLGQSKLAQGDVSQAMAAYQQALTLDPTLAIAHHGLGRLWRNHQDLDRALSHFQQAIQQAPHNNAALSDCARTLSAQGQWRDLFDCFRLAISHQPEFVAAYCDRTIHLCDEDLLFRLQRACGRFLMGLRYADAEIAYSILCERLGQLYQYLGELSVACDAPTQAEKFYQLALTLMPNALEIYGRLGDCLIGQGRQAAAIAIYQAGLLQLQAAQVAQSETELNSREELRSQLQNQLQKTLALRAVSRRTPSCADIKTDIKGVYRYTQDWQAAYGLADKRENAEAAVATSTLTPPNAQCGGVTCQHCMSGLIRRFSPTQVSKRSFRCNPAPMAEGFPTFTATIPHGRAWIAPKKNAWAVCNEIAVFTPDHFLLGDLSRCYPWYLPGCQRHDAANHTIFQRTTPLPAPQSLSGRVAILSGLSGHIYYHWLFDVLPRLPILQQDLQQRGLSLSDIDFFVVNNFEKAYQIETLRALGIPDEKVVASDRIPHIQADELIVPSFAGDFDWVPPSSIDFLRRTFLQSDRAFEEQISEQLPKKLYISRANAKYRHILNESAVIERLKPFGFSSVLLETLTVAQQARLFANAEVIVSPHGSGLANLTFCSPNTTVIECFSPHYLRTDYWMISQYLQLKHYYLVGESIACGPLRQLMYPSALTEDFSVDIAALRALLRTAHVID